MPGIENPNVVDLIARAPFGEHAMIMVAEAPWDDTPEQLNQLVAKINNYLAFATEGGLASAYPDAIGKPLLFQLDCIYPASEAVHQAIAEIRPRLDRRGIKVRVNLLS